MISTVAQQPVVMNIAATWVRLGPSVALLAGK
jgi:hypothetical protein